MPYVDYLLLAACSVILIAILYDAVSGFLYNLKSRWLRVGDCMLPAEAAQATERSYAFGIGNGGYHYHLWVIHRDRSQVITALTSLCGREQGSSVLVVGSGPTPRPPRVSRTYLRRVTRKRGGYPCPTCFHFLIAIEV